MKRKNKISLIAGSCLAGILIGGIAAIAQESSDGIVHDAIVVGYSQIGAESDWRIASTDSVKGAFSEDEGFYLIFDAAQQKQEKQIKTIRDFILQEVDYIVLNPIVESGWEMVLQEARDAEIPVIIVDRQVDVSDEDLYTCWIGSDFEQEAHRAGEWLSEYLEKQNKTEEEINIVILQGTTDSTAQIGRTKGLLEEIQKHPNWKVLDMQDGDFTQAKGKEVMEDMLKSYEDIDVVISENDNMTFGAIDAIGQSGRTYGPDGDITIISFDAVHAALEAMRQGKINADFECNPLHGPLVKETIVKLENKEPVDRVQYMEETWFDTSMDLDAIIKERTY